MISSSRIKSMSFIEEICAEHYINMNVVNINIIRNHYALVKAPLHMDCMPKKKVVKQKDFC